MDYDLNIAKCLVEKEAWGRTIVTNVCSGKVTEVPWQFGDFALVAFMSIMTLVMAAFMTAMIIAFMRD